MKKTAVICLLAIFLFNSMGYLVTFEVARLQARKEIDAKLSLLTQKDLAVITIPDERSQEIEWHEEGREMKYRDKMYDIIRIQKKGAYTTYYGIPDDREKLLYEGLDQYVENYMQNGAGKGNPSSKKVKEQTTELYFNSIFELPPGFFSITGMSFISTANNYSSVCHEISSPPPEFS
jgi:hypothetical protein